MKSSVNQTNIDGQLAMDVIRDWKASAALRAEFRSISTYVAFVQAHAAGCIKFAGGSRGNCDPRQ